jgi:threonine dehydratase
MPNVTRDDVLRARATIGTRLPRTPTFSSRTLGARLKCELFQRTGSFKARGALNKLTSLTAEEKRRGAIAISAGNHAQAVAFAAAEEGVDALVVMWRGASEQKVNATRGYGAQVDLEADGPAGAFDRLHELQSESGRVLIHPFDDPTVIAGAGTVGLEIEEDAPGVDVVVVPVGGGGLVAGIAAAVAPRGVRVVGVEPEGSAALLRGLEAGEPVPVAPETIASGLDAPFAGTRALEVCAAAGVEVVTVPDDRIAEGMRRLYGDAKLACEPAAAAGVAAVLAGAVEGDSIVVVVSGGNVGPEIASDILAGR